MLSQQLQEVERACEEEREKWQTETTARIANKDTVCQPVENTCRTNTCNRYNQMEPINITSSNGLEEKLHVYVHCKNKGDLHVHTNYRISMK